MVHCDREGWAVSQDGYSVSAGTGLSAGVTGILLWQKTLCQKLSAKFPENISCGDEADRILISIYVINGVLA